MATFTSATDVPITASSYSAANSSLTLALDFSPPTGTNLTVVNNTGLNFINGAFSNLAQGQHITLIHNEISYPFVANYYGGTGNDLVLQWANTRPVGWGENFNGQICDATITTYRLPANVVSNGALATRTLTMLGTGLSHSAGICADGTVVTWGDGSFGQMGCGSEIWSSSQPVAVPALGALTSKKAVAVAGGYSHTLVLCSDGTVAGFGRNSDGQLGDGSQVDSPTPLAVSTSGALAGKKVVAVAAGGHHSLALCSDGTVVAWGKNSHGQLGNDSTTDQPVPILVTYGALAGKTVVAVSAGERYSAALCSDGTVACWGQMQLRYNGPIKYLVPTAVEANGLLAGRFVVSISSGGYHCLALCSDGLLVAWGINGSFQLGNGILGSSPEPVAVDTIGALSGRTVVQISGGMFHSMALCSDGTIATWGNNQDGELGSGNNVDWTKIPNTVSKLALSPGERFVGAFSGSFSNHNLALIAVPPPPAVTSAAAKNLVSRGAELTGTVNAASGQASVSFEYGLAASLGQSTNATPATVTGSAGTEVSATLSGLTPNTTYYYRIVATTAGGTSQGAILTFTTPMETQESWRNFYFSTTQNTGSAADTADPDGDGTNNLLEYVAGLNPINPSSQFRVKIEMAPSQPGKKAITFGPITPFRTYTVKSKRLLVGEEWSPLTETMTSDNGLERTTIDLSSDNGPRFYRVEISLPQ